MRPGSWKTRAVVERLPPWICLCRIAPSDMVFDRPRHDHSHARYGRHVLQRRLSDILDGAEPANEHLLALRTDARHKVERRLYTALGASLPVEGYGEPVRLVPHSLDKEQALRTPGQNNRVFLIGERKALRSPWRGCIVARHLFRVRETPGAMRQGAPFRHQ